MTRARLKDDKDAKVALVAAIIITACFFGYFGGTHNHERTANNSNSPGMGPQTATKAGGATF